VKYEIILRPSAALLIVTLSDGEEITAAPGSWTYARGPWKVRTHAVRGSLAARLFGLSTFFYNTFYADGGEVELGFAPQLMGDVEAVELEHVCYVSERAFLAAYGDISLGIAWRGLKGWFAARRFIWLSVSGRGLLWLASCGGILKMESGGDLDVDTNDVVALCSAAKDPKMLLKAFGGFFSKSFLFGGEGFYLRVPSGVDAYVQTRPLSVCARMRRAYSSRSR